MNELLLIEFFTSQAYIKNLKEKQIFTEALNLVNKIAVDLIQNPDLKKLSIIRNQNLKKVLNKKIFYHETNPKKNIFDIVDKLSLKIPTILIAPESDRIAIKLTEYLGRKTKLLNSSLKSIKVFSSKFLTINELIKNNIPCLNIKNLNQVNTNEIISKPIYGAGSENIRIFNKKNFKLMKGFIYQEFYNGDPGSFSMLCLKKKFKVISCNLHIMKKDKFKISQIGSIIGGMEAYRSELEKLAEKIISKFDNLYGYIGVDVIRNKNQIKVVEINCRFTSTYIGLKNAYGDKAIKLISDFYVKEHINQEINLKLLKKKKIIFYEK